MRKRKAVKRRSVKKQVVRRVSVVLAGGKEISVMAWIEDPFGKVLLVKQKRGKRLWSFPGGKVKPREPLLNALKRELREEVNLVVDVAAPVDMFDRWEKRNLTVLFRVILKSGKPLRIRKSEIERVGYYRTVPLASTPSLRYFWQRAQKSFEPLTSLV